ncbi:MAG: hypothetical protein JEY97_00830 [Bacteroidales bacterium]|nr:hypothetical protein [Bacteroidales bacterium]
MRTNEIIKEIQRLPFQKRIYIIEKTIHSLRKQENINQMEKAVNDLLPDYELNSELTVFTNLDFEDFYETR